MKVNLKLISWNCLKSKTKVKKILDWVLIIIEINIWVNRIEIHNRLWKYLLNISWSCTNNRTCCIVTHIHQNLDIIEINRGIVSRNTIIPIRKTIRRIDKGLMSLYWSICGKIEVTLWTESKWINCVCCSS